MPSSAFPFEFSPRSIPFHFVQLSSASFLPSFSLSESNRCHNTSLECVCGKHSILLCFVVLSIRTNNKYKYKNSHFCCTTKRKTFSLSFVLSSTLAHKMVKRGKTFVRSLLYEKYAQILIQTKLHAHSVFIYGNCYLLNGRICCTERICTQKYGNQWQPILQRGRGNEKDFSQKCKQADIVNEKRRSKLCIFILFFLG